MNKILYFVFVQLFLLLIVCQDVKVEFVLLARTGNDAKSVSYGFKWLLVGTGMTLPPPLASYGEACFYFDTIMTKCISQANSAFASFGYEHSKSKEESLFAIINSEKSVNVFKGSPFEMVYPFDAEKQIISEIKFISLTEAMIVNKSNSLIRYVNFAEKTFASVEETSYDIVDVSVGLNTIVAYLKDKISSKEYFKIYRQNYFNEETQLIELQELQEAQTFEKVYVDEKNNLILRIFLYQVEFYSLRNEEFLHTFSLPEDLSYISNPIICKGIFIFSSLNQIYFYNVTTWELITETNSSDYIVQNIKCFEDESQIGVLYQESPDYLKNKYSENLIDQLAEMLKGIDVLFDILQNLKSSTFSIHYFSIEILEDENNEINEATENKEENKNIENNEESNKPNSEFSLEEFEKSAIELLENPTYKEASSTISEVLGTGISIGMSSRILEPFLSILSDFWFYQYHIVEYPKIVQYFTKEVDLLNELRIKPDFLDINIEISKIDEQNNIYGEVFMIHEKQPNGIYALKSLEEVYIINFGLSATFFLTFFLLFHISKMCTCNYSIFRTIRKHLHEHCYWWCLFGSCIGSNISVLTFFSIIQFNAFGAFQFFDKISLILATRLMFLTMGYVFFIYVVIFTFYPKSKTRKIFGVSKYSEKGLLLEMSLVCIFPFLSALAHGFFIRLHEMQITSLIILNILEILLIIKYRVYFRYRIDMITSVLYKLGFLIFNLTILTLRIFQHHNFYKDIPFNYIFLFSICYILVLSLIKIVVAFGIIFYEKIKCFSNDPNKESIVENQKKVSHSAFAKTTTNKFLASFYGGKNRIMDSGPMNPNSNKNMAQVVSFTVTCKTIEEPSEFNGKSVKKFGKLIKTAHHQTKTMKNLFVVNKKEINIFEQQNDQEEIFNREKMKTVAKKTMNKINGVLPCQ